MPGKQLKIEAKVTKPGTHKTDYESQRKDKIAANKRVMEELGLQQDKQALSSACQKPKRPPVTPRARQMLDLTPKRISKRAASKPKVEYSLDKLFGEIEGEYERKRRRTGGGGGGGRARAANGESAYQGERNLPDSYDRHNRSCHICTQGVCSWRGAFRLPLKCSKCRTIWCDRCLRNIFGEKLFPPTVTPFQACSSAFTVVSPHSVLYLSDTLLLQLECTGYARLRALPHPLFELLKVP